MTVAMSLPWSKTVADEDFSDLVRACLIVTVLLCVIVPLITVPEKSREETEKLPPQLAEIILREKPPVPVPEPPPPPVETVEPEPVPEPPLEAVKAEVAQTVSEAREKARSAGVLAFANDLAALRDLVPQESLRDTASLTRGEGAAATVDRSVIAAADGGRRANINVADLSTAVGGVALAAAESTRVEGTPDPEAPRGAVRLVATPEEPSRSIEDVRRVFDANKGAIYAIYNRELRKQPGLVGKVVLALTIEPDGRVSVCEVVSAELDSDAMLQRLVQRVQMFDFGARDVAVTRISYPVHFLPS